ncbi:MAG: PD-(D/E)XK nuclease family protein, partial [Terracidiphilus sp.]
MGDRLEEVASPEIDAWLREGALVVTASERATRSLLQSYHRARRSEGLAAWPTPNIHDLQSFVRDAWELRNPDGRLVLSGLQEPSLWVDVLAEARISAGLLDGPRQRLANLAVEAHQLLCTHAPQYLQARMRNGWQQDAGEFSAWLAEFDEACRRQALVSAARLPLELIELLKKEPAARPPILLAGFDRVLPTQRRLFAAWSAGSEVRQAKLGEPARIVQFYGAADPARELAACAIWCRRQLDVNPNAQLLVVTQDVAQRRGEIERAFLRFAAPDGPRGANNLVEFSLGVSLGQIALAKSAKLLLKWFSSSLEENEVDWLLSSVYSVANPDETLALTGFMRAIRRKGWQRTRWTLPEFSRQKPGAEFPAMWSARMTQARQLLADAARKVQSPLVWAELVPRLLQTAGWLSGRALTSVEYQVQQRWERTVDETASLGFNGRQIAWDDFLENLDRIVDQTLFAPESLGAPILIAGPAESAGLTADAAWFLGANEDSWPPRGATHPLLPLGVQREAGMPHAVPQVDWDLAEATTRRLLASASEMNFSYARQVEGVEKRPSHVVAQVAEAARPLPVELLAESQPAPIALPFADTSRVPFPAGTATGGSGILTSQSQCAFKAFATARLDAASWDRAEAGLTPPERGLLLHEVMHRIWGGPPAGIRSHEALMAIGNLGSFVASHVRAAMREKTPLRARDSMPARYLDLEGERLTALISEWLRYEQARVPFTVEQTETNANPSIAGLELHLRLDRVDRLNDGSLLVIDYKTGNNSSNEWNLPRPEDVQLPLYAGFALDDAQGQVGGIAFAKLRAGKCEFQGKLKAARATLRSDLRATTNLVKQPLAQEDMAAWREEIEKLARDFLVGSSDVNPRDYPNTCERCRLQALCRIQELQRLGDDGDGNAE